MIVAVCGLVVLAVSCAPAFGPATLRVDHSPERAKVVERFRGVSRPAVLFVGNSYSIPVPRVFRRQCKARGTNVRVGLAAHGGWSLAQHAAHEPTLRAIREIADRLAALDAAEGTGLHLLVQGASRLRIEGENIPRRTTDRFHDVRY